MDNYYIGLTTKFEPNSVLRHHGILGQKWGVKNGPPYPLGSDISTGKRLKSSYGDTLTTVFAVEALTYATLFIASAVVKKKSAAEAKRKKEKFEEERSKAPIDKATGLHKKTKSQTIVEDAERINPEFKIDVTAQRNCMLCASAYDMRRRGYEVQALKSDKGFDVADLNRWYPKAKIKTVSDQDEAGNHLRRAQATNLVKELSKQPNGARGNIMIMWSPFSGHSMAYEIVDGKPKIIDSQANKVYDDMSKFQNSIYSVQYARLDNVEFDKKKIKECVR